MMPACAQSSTSAGSNRFWKVALGDLAVHPCPELIHATLAKRWHRPRIVWQRPKHSPSLRSGDLIAYDVRAMMP